MSDIASPRHKPLLSALWLTFAAVNAWLMYLLPGEETIPYHLIWASYALLYGLYRWPTAWTWVSFWVITAVTGVAIVRHAQSHVIGWEECSEILLMGVLVALLIWHVNRQLQAQDTLAALRELEANRAEQRDVTARFGSHEVRTRLTIARGFAEMIRDTAPDETTRADAAVVVSELLKATATATNLLALVRIDTSAVPVHIEVDDLVASIVARWSSTAERTWVSDVRVRTMMADAERFETALDCLIENAVKFTSVGDSITVAVDTDEDDLIVVVRDSGVGIPPDELPHVTELFTTGRGAGDRAGSGLGLAIVRTIVESRGGSLSVTSEPGVGTAVTIRMPASAVAPALASGRSGLEQFVPNAADPALRQLHHGHVR